MTFRVRVLTGASSLLECAEEASGGWPRVRGAGGGSIEERGVFGEIRGGFAEGVLHQGAELEIRWRVPVAGEDDKAEAKEDEHELEDGHSFLEHDLVGQEAEASRKG